MRTVVGAIFTVLGLVVLIFGLVEIQSRWGELDLGRLFHKRIQLYTLGSIAGLWLGVTAFLARSTSHWIGSVIALAGAFGAFMAYLVAGGRHGLEEFRTSRLFEGEAVVWTLLAIFGPVFGVGVIVRGRRGADSSGSQ